MIAGPDFSRAGAHDLGGQSGGPIDRAEHPVEPWQKLVTAILVCLLRKDIHIARIDELRRAIESMTADDYDRLKYFERWAVGVSTLVVEKGLVTGDEIERRIRDMSARLRMEP